MRSASLPRRMSSDPSPSRVLVLPGSDFNQKPIPVTPQRLRIWFRVHRAGAPPILFGNSPHHRFSHRECPYPLLYVGASIQTCLWEVFGDDVFRGKRTISETRWRSSCISQITVPALGLCALTLERTRDAMNVDRASLLAADLTVPQAWGLAVQRHPAGFHAIKYSSRFMDQACLALFDRGTFRVELKAELLGALNDLDAAVDWLHERKAALV
jgi:hypothetical protein